MGKSFEGGSAAEAFPSVDTTNQEGWPLYAVDGQASTGSNMPGELEISVDFMKANPFMAPEVQHRCLTECGIDPSIIEAADKIVYDLK